MTKHTPAPWGFFRADIGFDDEAWVVDQTSERELDEDGDIHLYFQIARVTEEEDDDGVAEANARLMAAAPTMLDALLAWSKVRRHFFGDPYIEDVQEFADGAEAAIRAAIGDETFEAMFPGSKRDADEA
jgi:hypothetical protein